MRAFEQLEDRRLLSVTEYTPHQDISPVPAIGLQTGKFIDAAAYQKYYDLVKTREDYGSGPDYPDGYGRSGINQAEGLTQPVINAEIEPNNLNLTGQVVPLDPNNPELQTAIILGSLNNTPSTVDVDHYTLNLRGGDILDIKFGSSLVAIANVQLLDAQGRLLATSFGPPPADAFPTDSPLNRDGLITFAQVIPRDGTYQVRVDGGAGAYQVQLRAFRNPIESQPIGTIPELFLDFDGAAVDRTEFGFTGPNTGAIATMPSLASALGARGYGPAQINQLIDAVVRRVAEDFNGTIPTLGANGDFVNDGVPGNYALRITNSRDHGDRWGLPNVTRVVITTSAIPFFEDPAALGIVGIASSIDVGNFDLTETVMTFADDFYTLGAITGAPLSPGTSELEYFASFIATTTSHELGHSIGLWHTNPFNNVNTMMDPFVIGEEGLDGIFGTADDIDLDFIPDNYRIAAPAFPNFPGEYLLGYEEQGVTVSHVLASGTRGATINGSVYNDLNQSGSKQAGEFGVGSMIVFADLNGNFLADIGEPRAISNADGTYTLRGPAGRYFVRALGSGDFRPSGNGVEVNVNLDSVVSNINVGLFIANQAVTGFKWIDTNGDGLRTKTNQA